LTAAGPVAAARGNRLAASAQAVAAAGAGGWLLYDFRGSNALVWRMLGTTLHSTRRVFLWIPPESRAVLLVHHVDAGHFPAEALELRPYRDGDELKRLLGDLLPGRGRVAMEYSPMGELPALSCVDGGTLDLVRSFGVSVESSAELAQQALCRLDPADLASHRRAAAALGAIVGDAFAFTGRKAPSGVTEHEVADFIRAAFTARGLETSSGPVVAVGAHAGDPHYEPSARIRVGDWVLIDLWAREPGGIYGDITWVGYLGEHPPAQHQAVFDVVAGARDAATAFIAERLAAGDPPAGWEADAVARRIIAGAGFGPWFTHRLGHSLGEVVHGYGANLDGYETRDTRRLVPGLAFTIEPGVYLPEFGVRCEIDLYVGEAGLEVTSPVQREIVRIPVG